MVKYILAILLSITSPAWAICNTVSTDGNTRLKNLAQDEFDQSVKEFQNDNPIRACEHLKLSRSYIKQTDEKIATEYIVVLYNKMCEVK
jgi:protein associated with RNAse G/E